MLCFPSVKNRNETKIIFDSCKKRQISSQNPTKTKIPYAFYAIPCNALYVIAIVW